MPRRTCHLLPTPLFSPPGKSTGASPSPFLLATKAPASPKKPSAPPTSPFTFPTKRFRLKESMSLFSNLPASPADSDVPAANQPLAERMRPRTLDEFIGQEKLLGPGKPLRTQIESDN